MVLVALICVSAVFAADNTVKVSAVPYGFQISTSSAEGAEAVKSRFGLGLEATYQKKLNKGLLVEAGIGWNTFFITDKPAFTDILVSAGVGYKFDINDKFSCSASAAVGADTLIYNGKGSANITLKARLEGSYAITDSVSVHVGCQGTFGFAKKDSTNFVNYRILPVMGAAYEF